MPVFTGAGSIVTSSNIVDGTIVNADISAAAAISRLKLGSSCLVKATMAASQALSTTLTRVNFDTESIDIDSALASNQYVSPRAQTVMVVVNLLVQSTEVTIRHVLAELRVNNVAIRQMYDVMGNANPLNGSVHLVEFLTLAQNDIVDIFAASGATSQTIIGGGTFSSLTILNA